MCDTCYITRNVPIKEINNYRELQQLVTIRLANGTLKQLKIFAQQWAFGKGERRRKDKEYIKLIKCLNMYLERAV